MTSSMFPSSNMGLPSMLKYDLPPSLSDSSRSYSVNVAPDGITSVSGSLNSISHTNAVATQSPFSSQNVSFTIPSGMSDSVFMDTNSTTISFTLTYTVSTTLVGNNLVTKLLSSANSWFDSLQLLSNNTPIESINQYGLLSHFLLSNTVNLAERYGGISVCMGTDANSASGIDLGTSVGTYRYNFCLPLMSVIGFNTDKFFPVGSVNNLQLQLTTAVTTPIVCYNSILTTNVALSSAPMLSEFRLNLKYIDIGDVAAQMLRQTLQDGKWYIKSSTYTNSNVSIPSGSFGTLQLLLQIRNSSVKSVYHYFALTNTTLTPNGLYDAINPGLNIRQLQTGSGNFYPNYPCNDLQRPAESYAVLIAALGGSIPKSYGTVVSREMYNTIAGVLSVPANSDTYVVLPTANTRAAPVGSDNPAQTITSYPSSAFYGYDLEKSSGVLFQGVNTRSSPPFLNLNLALATSTNISCFAWGYSDVVLQIDTVSKQVQAFI